VLNRQKRKLLLPFLTPALLLYGVFFLYPAGRTFYVALTSWNGIDPDLSFIGFGNFRELADDPIFHRTIRNTAVFTVLGAIVLFPLALFLAFATSEKLFGARTFRFIILAPVALSVATAALLWKFALNPNFGLMNGLLDAVGLEEWSRPWLGMESTAMIAVVLATVWHGVGIWMIFFAAAITRVPQEMKEAARIDGASSWRIFRHIVFPLIWDVTRILIVLWIIGALQAFAFIFAMTNGGPLNATNVFGTYLYNAAFVESRFGYAAAIAVAMFALILCFTVLVSRLTRRETVQY
jgi:raffinose/stachyose/melibiose transport system permease protein/N-acetylglucosamine transport system permease protein